MWYQQEEGMGTNLPARAAQFAVEVLPDTPRYKFRFKVPSSSSDDLYLISYDNAPGAHYWTCSCCGNIRHGSCRHLEACGLKGRKFGRSELKDYGIHGMLGG